MWEHEPGTPPPTVDRIADYWRVAESRGISEFAITEHVHRFDRIAQEVLPHWERSRSGPLAVATDRILTEEGGADLDSYAEGVLAAREAGIPVRLGMEVDYLPGTVEAMGGVLADYPFDVLLGSIHWLDEWLFDALEIAAFAGEWARREVSEVWNTYVDRVLELAASGLVDVLAHLDLIKIAGRWPDDQRVIEDRLIGGLAGSGLTIEYSTSGLDKPGRELYPSPGLMDRVLAAGLSFTTASDAHDPYGVGEGFDAFRADFACRGITQVTAFDRRHPEGLSLAADGLDPAPGCSLEP